jgi:hypothetical protein
MIIHCNLSLIGCPVALPGLPRRHLPEAGRPHGAACLGLRLESWLAIGLVVYFTYGRSSLAAEGAQVAASR